MSNNNETVGSLVLSRKKGQTVKIGEDITIEFAEVSGTIARIKVTAPKTTSIVRGELEKYAG